MKIGVISDTHGGIEVWRKIMKGIFSEVDMVIHGGDLFNYGPRNPMPGGFAPGDLLKEMNDLKIPLIVARGNCDSEIDTTLAKFPIQAPFALLQVDSLRILANHGDVMEDDEKKLELAKKWNINIFISGHTHRPKLAREGNVVLLNPGSPALPKEEPTVAVISKEGEEFEIKIINVDTGKVLIE